MTLLRLPAGLAYHQAHKRLRGEGMWLPRLLTDGSDSSNSTRAIKSFTAHASVAHTVGNWTEIVSSLSEDVGWVKMTSTFSTGSSGTNTSTLFNLGIGTGGAETIIIPSVGIGYSVLDASADQNWMFPIFIPKGTRVAGQIQSAVTGKTYEARFEFFAPTHGQYPSSKILSIGADTSTSRGVTLSTPGANNTEGAWTQITAATDEPFEALGVCVQGGGNTGQPNANILVDVAIGASSSEVPIITNLAYESFTSETFRTKTTLVHPVSVPKGSRLSARWQGSAITGAVDVSLLGIRPAR